MLAAAMGGSVFLLPDPVSPLATAGANTGCSESTYNFGTQSETGTCTITTDTYWWNGTLTITGSIVLNADLTLNNLYIEFDSSSDEQYGMTVTGDLGMTGGGISSPGSYHWALSGGGTSTIDGSAFNRSRPDFAANSVIENSYFNDTDNGAGSEDEGISLDPNSTFRWNELWDWSLDQDAAIFTHRNWGGILIWGNELHLNCDGTNCMGIEPSNSQDEQTTVNPTFPAIEIAWNNITWEDINGAGSLSITLDNEYSDRLYLHNNTQFNDDPEGDPVNACLQGGGVKEGIYENNTCWGPQNYPIYQYVYGDTEGNRLEYNFFNDSRTFSMIEIGNAVVRHNVFENMSLTPLRLCGDSDGGCAGANANPRDFFWYNNTVTWTSGSGRYVARMSDENDQFNTVVQPGDPTSVTQWDQTDPTEQHTIPGDSAWLYKSDQTIDRIHFVNNSDGTRWVNLTINGGLFGGIYPSQDPNFGATDNAALSLEGPIDQSGSMNINDDEEGTFLWQLGRDNATVDVLAGSVGTMYFNVTGFYLSQGYDVSIWNYSGGAYENTTFTTDGAGAAQFTKAMAASKYNISMAAQGVGEWSNSAPVISDLLTTDEAGHNLSYSEGFTATDVDANQTLLWTLATNGSFLSIASSDRTSTVSGAPLFADRDATFYVNVTVSDQASPALTDYSNYTLYANNTTPTITNGISSDSTIRGQAYAVDFDHADLNADTPTWSLSSDNSFLSVEVSTGWVNGTPEDTGSFYVDVTVVDYSGSGASINYTLTVGSLGGAGTGRIHITSFTMEIRGWDTVFLRSAAELKTADGETTNETLTYRWDFGDGSTSSEGPEVLHIYAIGFWASYAITLRVCTLSEVVCETRATEVLLIHWPIWGGILGGLILTTAIVGHLSVRRRVLRRSR